MPSLPHLNAYPHLVKPSPQTQLPKLRLRYDAIDALRGLAMIWMTIFHFCFDLVYFGFSSQNFYADPFWTLQRTLIVSLFVFCAGLGQAVAQEQVGSWHRFWKRWWKIAACAVAITAASSFMFPRSYIYFGVLHGIAAMLIIVRLTSKSKSWVLWLMGATAIALPLLWPLVLANAGASMSYQVRELLDSRLLNWIGLISRKPVTEDYVPLLPWLGVMWWGVAAGRRLLSSHRAWLSKPRDYGLPKWLARLGRWSLPYYMVHQPVMLAVLAGVAWLIAPN